MKPVFKWIFSTLTMKMKVLNIYEIYNKEIYFFLLKQTKDENVAKDVMQNTFLKAYENYNRIRDIEKTKAWLFRIARNELINYYHAESAYAIRSGGTTETDQIIYPEVFNPQRFCCLHLFINELPQIYRVPIQLVYQKGTRQTAAAALLHISLPTMKARIRRAKIILQKKFHDCCHYEIDKNGKMIGEENCTRCNGLSVR